MTTLKDFMRRLTDTLAGKWFTEETGRIEELIEASHAREKHLNEFLVEINDRVTTLVELQRWLDAFPPTDGDLSGRPDLVVVHRARQILAGQPRG